jgi:hypothetical protein
VSAAEARYPHRERQPRGEWFIAHAATVDDNLPTTYEEALARPDAELWRAAMDEEMASLAENKTW